MTLNSKKRIILTAHAIQRLRERFPDYTIQDMVKFVTQAMNLGKKTRNTSDSCVRYKFGDTEVVIDQNTVVTVYHKGRK